MKFQIKLWKSGLITLLKYCFKKSKFYNVVLLHFLQNNKIYYSISCLSHKLQCMSIFIDNCNLPKGTQKYLLSEILYTPKKKKKPE